MKMTDSQRQQLIDAAAGARANAYAPYSNYLVGAAILTSDGQIFAGCNVENASYGLAICAERAAMCAAVSAGQKQFVAAAVITSHGHAPCGACRQALAEFGADMSLLLIDANNQRLQRETTLSELLPDQFRL